MLPMDAKRNADSYSFPNGMLNSGWIAGVLRNPDPSKGICYIQQTRNENHMLPIEFDPRKTPLPTGTKELDLVMAYCHVVGGRDGDHRVVRLKSIRFEGANMMHLDKRASDDLLKKWAVKAHQAAKDSGVPDSIKALEKANGPVDVESRLEGFDWRVMQMNRNASNHIRLAGFVQAKSLEQKRTGLDGKPMNDRLIVLLRQTEDPEKCISVRWYGRNLEAVAKTLRRGLPIFVSGEFRLDVKAIGAPDPESGFAPVSKIPYIYGKDLPGPVLPDESEKYIKVIPWWAAELYNDLGKEPSKAADASADPERTKLFAEAFQSGTEGGANG